MSQPPAQYPPNPPQPGTGEPGPPVPYAPPYSTPGPYPPPGNYPSPGTYQPYAGYRSGPYPAAPWNTGRDPRLAEWWQRLLANVLDTIAVAVPFAVLNLAFTFVPGMGRFHNIGAIALIVVISFVYYSVQHAVWGQTLGKRALGTKVVTADGMARISAGAAAVRAAVYVLISVFPTAIVNQLKPDPSATAANAPVSTDIHQLLIIILLLLIGLVGLLDGLWLLWDRRRQCLHDKVARTVVVEVAELAAGPAPWPGPAAGPAPGAPPPAGPQWGPPPGGLPPGAQSGPPPGGPEPRGW